MAKCIFYNPAAGAAENRKRKMSISRRGIQEQSRFLQHRSHLLRNRRHFLIENCSSRNENYPAWHQLRSDHTESLMEKASCTVSADCPFVELTGTDDSAFRNWLQIGRTRSGIQHDSQKADLLSALFANFGELGFQSQSAAVF